VGTTGLATMDYLLADPHEIPPGAERWYRERILRMPDDYICYDPPADAPPVNRLPALEHGRITFGSFNLPAKTTPEIVAVWARLLHRLPQARLRLMNRGFASLRLDGLRGCGAAIARTRERAAPGSMRLPRGVSRYGPPVHHHDPPVAIRSDASLTAHSRGASQSNVHPFLHSLSSLDRWFAVCEFRPETMHWLVGMRRTKAPPAV
jgi:hypothetical protein